MLTRRSAFARILLGGAAYAALCPREAAAETVQYTYDALGRVLTVTYGNGATITYAYDALGNRTTLSQTAPTAVQSTLSANPTAILQGSSASLTWTTLNATSVSINNGVGSVTPVSGGSVSVSPSVTTTYTLTATGAAGSHQSQATINVTPNVFTATIQITGTGAVNLRTLANTAGYNGSQDATITFEVGNGVTLTGAAGAPAGGICIDSGTWPTGSYTIALTLVVKNGGIVRGGGGRGGAGAGNAGGAGGDAIYCRLPMSITFESGSQIRGGGGGGGGGASVEEGWPEPEYKAGGGGGGGAPNGTGGSGDTGASGGSGATTSGGGAGGAGSANGGVNGGNGGGYGANGNNGGSWISPPASGGAGGTAGYCVRKNGHTVPVTNNGSTSGTIG